MINYIGQLRVYSLADLLFLLIVAGASPTSTLLWGAVGLWVGFLDYLESSHQHQNRARVPEWFAWVTWSISVVMFLRIEGLVFILLSIIYAKKKHGQWGLVAPFVRGLQTLMLIVPNTGYVAWLPWVAALAIGWRNKKGDERDVEEDRADGMQTWPVAMGQEHDEPFGHLLGLVATTWLWWLFSNFSAWVPIMLDVIEVSTYWWTPRSSNKNANLSVRGKILLYHGRWGGR